MMNATLTNDVTVSINKNSIIVAPGYNSCTKPYVTPKADLFLNISMSEYQCKRKSGASILIVYRPFIESEGSNGNKPKYMDYVIIMALNS